MLDAGTPAVSIDAAAIADADFDSLIENAVHGEFPIENGMLSIERTRAMTMIDIDGGGDPMPLNLAAALEIPRLCACSTSVGKSGSISSTFLTAKHGCRLMLHSKPPASRLDSMSVQR
ncbi:MAG: hypothetical protein IPL18_12150 [Sphingomonadales bacterium]|nr:hypothetical protein [Sphingomonadales bacterium]